MTSFLKKAGLGVALGATTLAMTAAPAQAAQRWHRYHHHGGDDAAAAAIVGGIIGLGIGAAIASDNDDGYYNGYYDNRYYAPAPGYYDRGYAPGYYDYRYRPRCYVQDRWDPYYRRHVRVRVCR